jgi:hypothetical protein
MLKKFVLAFAILGLSVASAETYRLNLNQPSKIEGKALKAGDYKLNLENSKLTISMGKQTVEVPVKVQTGDTKFESNAIRYQGTGEQVTISEIRIGGTKTKLLFQE